MRESITRRGFLGSATAAAAAPCLAGSSALGLEATPASSKPFLQGARDAPQDE